MARTLPWLKTASTTSSHPSNPRPSKRQRTHSPSSDTSTRPPLPPSKREQPPFRSARTPSTSPPPLPPPPSPLRPGLNADDIYIMVEDEFLATARAFTAHLHHAEYVRLKNAAREKARDGIGVIERPVDGRTEMRVETRKRKEADAYEKKVRGAVGGIVAPKEGKRPSDDEGEEGSDFEDEGERHDDPWAGTQLQHFMTKSPIRNRGVGLTGLQGVVSHTRAAAGFQKWEKRDRDGRGGSPTPAKGVNGMTYGDGGDREEEEDEDTDDLDAPTYTRPPPPTSLSKTKPKASQPAAVKHPSAPATKSNPPRRAFLDMTPLPKQQPPKPPPDPQPAIKQQPVVKFERHDSDNDKGEDVLRGIRERAEARRRRRGRGREGRGTGREGVGEEIPVFLV